MRQLDPNWRRTAFCRSDSIRKSFWNAERSQIIRYSNQNPKEKMPIRPIWAILGHNTIPAVNSSLPAPRGAGEAQAKTPQPANPPGGHCNLYSLPLPDRPFGAAVGARHDRYIEAISDHQFGTQHH
jgi:hypothetical protein